MYHRNVTAYGNKVNNCYKNHNLSDIRCMHSCEFKFHTGQYIQNSLILALCYLRWLLDFKTSYSSGTEEIEIFKLYNIGFSSYGYLHFVFDKCDNYFNFWNIFHSRLAASLSAASRWGQCDVFMHRPIAAVWPDWAIYWILGKFLKPLATINLPKSPTFLGYWCQNHSFFQ